MRECMLCTLRKDLRTSGCIVVVRVGWHDGTEHNGVIRLVLSCLYVPDISEGKKGIWRTVL